MSNGKNSIKIIFFFRERIEIAALDFHPSFWGGFSRFFSFVRRGNFLVGINTVRTVSGRIIKVFRGFRSSKGDVFGAIGNSNTGYRRGLFRSGLQIFDNPIGRRGQHLVRIIISWNTVVDQVYQILWTRSGKCKPKRWNGLWEILIHMVSIRFSLCPIFDKALGPNLNFMIPVDSVHEDVVI